LCLTKSQLWKNLHLIKSHQLIFSDRGNLSKTGRTRIHSESPSIRKLCRRQRRWLRMKTTSLNPSQHHRKNPWD
jgi:hypothetical protein